MIKRLLFLLLFASPTIAQTVPQSFFSLTTNVSGTYPTAPSQFSVGGMRLWDTGTKWDEINTAAGVYNFTNVNNRLAEAQTRGVDVIWTMGCVPNFIAATSGATTPCQGSTAHSSTLPSDVNSGDTTWKNFITALVNDSLAHPPGIKYYEMNNEPDLTQYCTTLISGTNTPCNTSPANLVTMVHDAYTIIHTLDPSALVIGPSPSTACTNNCGVHFLPAYYAAGGWQWQDIVGFHAYMYTTGAYSSVPEQIVNYISQVKTLMAARGISSQPIFVTEGTWGGSPTNGAMTDDQKIAYMAREHLLMRMNGIARYYWYAYSNTSWGTFFTGGSLTAAGRAYALLQNWMVGSTDLNLTNCSQDGSQTWRCNITYHGQPAVIFWNPTNTPSISFSAIYNNVLSLDNATITPFVGNLTAGLKPRMAIAGNPLPPPSPPPLFSFNCTMGCKLIGQFRITGAKQ